MVELQISNPYGLQSPDGTTVPERIKFENIHAASKWLTQVLLYSRKIERIGQRRLFSFPPSREQLTPLKVLKAAKKLGITLIKESKKRES